MTIPTWVLTIWVWVGIGIVSTFAVGLLLWMLIIVINVQGRSLHRKMTALYAFREVDYWLGQHIRLGKIMMSDTNGKMVWVATSKADDD